MEDWTRDRPEDTSKRGEERRGDPSGHTIRGGRTDHQSYTFQKLHFQISEINFNIITNDRRLTLTKEEAINDWFRQIYKYSLECNDMAHAKYSRP